VYKKINNAFLEDHLRILVRWGGGERERVLIPN